tara:strand:- start:21 stop:257 length:237 start_codon:yes stop_codon:yes gene_type:complete
MSESTHDYYLRKMQEVRENKPMSQVDIYRKNIADLQEQLQNSYIKQKQLNDELYELRKRMEQLEGHLRAAQAWNNGKF